MTEYVYKLRNGKSISAYADEKGNISITKEVLEIMVNGWNVGYQKGYSDGHIKGKADAIEEFKQLFWKSKVEFRPSQIDEILRTLEQLKEQKGE